MLALLVNQNLKRYQRTSFNPVELQVDCRLTRGCIYLIEGEPEIDKTTTGAQFQLEDVKQG
jgi:KaiC/GvpD/RAD55 family RecA-like ATPase